MDKHADTGDIVAQERVALPDGIRYTDAEKILSAHAARLLINALGAAPNGSFTRTPQARTAAPPAPNPSERDFFIATDWNVQRAFNFARGIGERTLLVMDNQKFFVREAISFEENEKLAEPVIQEKDFSKIQFANGTLIAKISPIS